MSVRNALFVCLALLTIAVACAQEATPVKTWQLGTPIVTYWAGPPMTEAMAKQMAEGGFNLVWCTEQELDNAHKFGLRAYLYGGPMSPEALDDPAKRAELEAYIARVKNHPALYAYHLQDEPTAGRFPALARLVAFLREKDPAHLAYINLFPTYANNEQLGTEGDTVTAYQKHLDLFMEQVKPALLSYDHYHFGINGNDGGQYFLNLAMIRKAAQDAGIPFMSIVQACTWSPGMRRNNASSSIRRWPMGVWASRTMSTATPATRAPLPRPTARRPGATTPCGSSTASFSTSPPSCSHCGPWPRIMWG